MPYAIRKLPNKDLYRVRNKETGKIYAYGTTKDKAEKQVRLLYLREREKKSGKKSAKKSGKKSAKSRK